MLLASCGPDKAIFLGSFDVELRILESFNRECNIRLEKVVELQSKKIERLRSTELYRVFAAFQVSTPVTRTSTAGMLWGPQ